MASSPKIMGRISIHRGESPASHYESQEEFSDSNESIEADNIHNSAEHLINASLETRELKKRNQSKTKHNNSTKGTSDFDNSLRDLRDKSRNTLVLESAGVVETPSIWKFKKFLPFVVVILLILYSLSTIFGREQSAQIKPGEQKKECSFDKLKRKYPKEDDSLWAHLKYGNEDILNNDSEKPAVFLFVHHKEHIADKIINDIAKTSSNCFGDSSLVQNMDLTAIDETHDYGHLIETYKKTIQEGHVVLIGNLNEINGEAAKALHAICDTITPLVKKVIILLSLTAERTHDEKVVYTAENALRQLWEKNIRPHELEPIIARVTDQVLLLKTND